MLEKKFGGTRGEEERGELKELGGGTARVKLEEASRRPLVVSGRQWGVGYKTVQCYLGLCLM